MMGAVDTVAFHQADGPVILRNVDEWAVRIGFGLKRKRQRPYPIYHAKVRAEDKVAIRILHHALTNKCDFNLRRYKVAGDFPMDVFPVGPITAYMLVLHRACDRFSTVTIDGEVVGYLLRRRQ
jgi:hypothetical protein